MCLFPNFVVNVGMVPCGRCPKCLERRVDHWVFRIEYEQRRAHSACFLTFTYADGMCDVTPNGFLTLNKSHFQLFMKRVRRALPNYPYKIKYYIAGEYGSDTERPHYHVIILNLPLDWLNAKNLDRFWYDDDGVVRGHIDYGFDFSSKAIGYTIGYCCKRRIVGRYSRDDRLPEYSCMSKGFGLNYLDDPSNHRFHQTDFLNHAFVTMASGKKCSLPRYYRDRIYSDGQRFMLAQQARLRDLEPDEDETHFMERCKVDRLTAGAELWKARVEYTNNYFKEKLKRRNEL